MNVLNVTVQHFTNKTIKFFNVMNLIDILYLKEVKPKLLILSVIKVLRE